MNLVRKKLFPLLAGVLWAVFLAMDLTGQGDSTPVKFAAICLCGIAAWTGCRTRDGLLVAVALTLTVCADVFLLVLDRSDADRIIGVSVFLAVQLLYAFRLYLIRGREMQPRGALLRLVGLGFARFLAKPGIGDPLVGLSAFYFLNLLVNTLEAFLLRGRARLFAWGLLLFLCCDFCVGFWNMGALGDFPRVGMWLFYLPSQVLIVLSQNMTPPQQLPSEDHQGGSL